MGRAEIAPLEGEGEDAQDDEGEEGREERDQEEAQRARAAHLGLGVYADGSQHHAGPPSSSTGVKASGGRPARSRKIARA